MRLRILLPYRVFLDLAGIAKLVTPTAAGSFGFLPGRLDCAAALVPGILEYTMEDGHEVFVAIDEGVLVKAGEQVSVAVRNAAGGADPGALKRTVEEEFMVRDKERLAFRTALIRFEGEFVRRFLEVRPHG